MKNTFLLIFFGGLIIFSSCRKDFSTIPSNGRLEFSKDTVFLDTVFTNIGSSTYYLKVYNRSDNDISIPNVQLAKGEDSNYRLNVDGKPGKSFENINILAKDSIYIMIETTADINELTDPLYTDEILFDSGSKQQDVKLVTLVQDAVFLFPNKENGIIETLTINGEDTEIKGRYLEDEELIFTDEKPYVIYGYMMVGTEENAPKTLTIQEGANIHFHNNSGLIINENSSLHILGSRDAEVLIQGDRLEPDYEEVPAQWGNIIFLNGSVNNYINHATIKNGQIGLLPQGALFVNEPVLEIHNTQIYNMSTAGILGVHTNIKADNLVINNCGISDILVIVGGVYNFTHCTFANSISPRASSNIWLMDSNKRFIGEDEDFVAADFYELNFTNCILGGRGKVELLIEQEGSETEINMHFSNNAIQFDDVNHTYADNPLLDFENADYYTDNVFNINPDFKDERNNDLRIGIDSEVKALALPAASNQVPEDILGTIRANPADLGAYEHIIFEE